MKEHLLAGLNVFGLSLLALADALWAPLDWLVAARRRPEPEWAGRLQPLRAVAVAKRRP